MGRRALSGGFRSGRGLASEVAEKLPKSQGTAGLFLGFFSYVPS